MAPGAGEVAGNRGRGSRAWVEKDKWWDGDGDCGGTGVVPRWDGEGAVVGEMIPLMGWCRWWDGDGAVVG